MTTTTRTFTDYAPRRTQTGGLTPTCADVLFDDIDDYDACALALSYSLDAPAELLAGSAWGWTAGRIRCQGATTVYRDSLSPTPTRVTPPRTTRTALCARSSAIGPLEYHVELRAGRGGNHHAHPAKIWIRGYDLCGRKCHEELFADAIDKRCTGPRSRCGQQLTFAAIRAAALTLT